MEEQLGTGEGEPLEEEVKTGTTTFIQIFCFLPKLRALLCNLINIILMLLRRYCGYNI